MLQQALLFTLIPLAAAVASGVVALFYTPRPGARSYIQHFAAGIVLAAADLLGLAHPRQDGPVAFGAPGAVGRPVDVGMAL